MVGFRITSLHAWVTIDPLDGNEGIVAFNDPVLGGWVPLVAADEQRMRQCEAMARSIGQRLGVTVSLVRFSAREDLQTVEPPPRD